MEINQICQIILSNSFPSTDLRNNQPILGNYCKKYEYMDCFIFSKAVNNLLVLFESEKNT